MDNLTSIFNAFIHEKEIINITQDFLTQEESVSANKNAPVHLAAINKNFL